MIKKEIVFVILGVLIIIGLIGFVSAASSVADDFSKMFEEFKGIFSAFFQIVLGESGNDAMFFQRCLILLVVYGIVYMVLSKMSLFEGSSFLLFFVSFAVAILGVRWLDNGLIQSILLPYAALGGSIAIFLPFLIYFTFVHTSVRGTFGRRTAWIIFGLIFIAVYITRGFSGDIGGWSSSYSYLYLFGFFALGACIFFDPQINMYFEMGKLGSAMSNFHKQEIRAALRDLRQLEKDYRNGLTTYADYNHERKRLENLIKKSSGHA